MSANKGKLPAERGTEAAVAEFLEKVAVAPAPRPGEGRGRLIFAMDATASREPTWDRACQIQGEMFKSTAALGGLEVQLVFYRGFGECKSSPWVADAGALVRRMTAVFCLAGQTQIAKVLRHAIAETKRRKVNAIVFVGDCMEESIDNLCQLAGELGLLGVPCFIFHEGGEPVAAKAF
ncbi:MAG TPA: VWA domain-containing protein, partial [Alphaproteobacteria bacterium]|nr:VWA domain-containing protein [Alphaproteobacteria bacterium]